MRIGVAVDVGADVSHDFVVQNNIHILPGYLHLGQDAMIDDREPQYTLAFYRQHLDDKGLNGETAAFSAEEIEDLFLGKLAPDYDHVFLITPSSRRSRSFQNAQRASLNFVQSYKKARAAEDKSGSFAMRVVDSQSLFTGPAVLAWETVRMIKEGRTPAEIRKRLDQLAFYTCAYLVPQDLHYLRSRAAARSSKSLNEFVHMLESASDTNSILRSYRGETAVAARAEHYENAVKKLFSFTAAQIRYGLMVSVLCISYGGDPAVVASLPGYQELTAVAQEFGVEIMLAPMSAAGGVHMGSGTLTLAYCAEARAFE